MEKKVMNGKALWNAKGGKRVQELKLAVRSHGAKRALMTSGVILALLLFPGAVVSPLWAQSYPTKPIRFVVPFPPGAAVDILGRIIAPKLAERLGQPVVCENRPGATGNVGIEFVAKARPDGYTIVIASPAIAISPNLYKKLGYDALKDVAPISLVAQGHLLMIVHPSLPVKNLKEFVEYARANPGKVNFGSAGIGGSTHLASELLKSLTKINIVHVPYKGVAPAMVGLMGGEIDMMVTSTVAAAVPHIQGGKMRPLAVLSNERLPSVPEVPTAKEAGIDGWVVTTWYGILAPGGTTRDIVNRLNAEWTKVAAMPDTREKMQNAEFEALSSTPEHFAEFIKSETARWARVIKEANILPMD